jgi:hypothetical protein
VVNDNHIFRLPLEGAALEGGKDLATLNGPLDTGPDGPF